MGGRARIAASLLGAALLVLAGGSTLRAEAPPTVVVREIAVEGLRRVQASVVLARLQTRPGAVLVAATLSEDVRRVHQLGFFSDVAVRSEGFEGGVRLTFVVIERPFLRDVDFAGQRHFTTTELQEKVTIRAGAMYAPAEADRARAALRRAYEEEGYLEVEVAARTETVGDGDLRLVFDVREGVRFGIDEIVIRGNARVPEGTLKDALATREREWLIFRGRVERTRLEQDVERLLAVYHDHGFLQARVGSPVVVPDRERGGVTITFDVVEGPQFRLEAVAFTGFAVLPEAELRRVAGLQAGKVYSRSALRQAVRRIADLYGAIGRAAADVTPRMETLADPPRVRLALEVAEGPEVRVGRITVTGNTRTDERVLRREIPLEEGSLFTPQAVARARQRLVNLGYFEQVEITTSPGPDPGRIDIVVAVVEQPTGAFGIGAAYSSAEGLLGMLDLSQNNLFGRGWQLRLGLRVGPDSQHGVLSFTEPWFLDRPMSVGGDAFVTTREYADYTYDTTGGALRLSAPFADYWRWHAQYRLSEDTIKKIAPNASSALHEEAGTRLTSRVMLSLSRDSRDNVFAPSRGTYGFMNLEGAGLGGDTRYLKGVTATSVYFPLWLDHVLLGRVEAGHGEGLAGQKLPLFERFFLGGATSIRGIKHRRLSPRDASGTRIGGTSELIGNVEYLVPAAPRLRFAGFFDIGNAYGFGTPFDPTDTREAVGVGLRWGSPFGPIRLDYGFNLDRRPGESSSAFHFSAGTSF